MPYAPIKYVSGKEMDYNLSLLTHLGVNAIGTYTVLPEEDPSEFIQVSYLENGKQVTELIHRDDYDTVMAQRN